MNAARTAPLRPRRVTVLAFAVLTLSGLHTARFILALLRWQDLAVFPGVSRLYIALTGAFWAAIGLPLAWGLWRGKIWASRLMRLAVFVFSAYYWLDRLWVANRGIGSTLSLPQNWLFVAVLNSIGIGLLLWVLSSPSVRSFFGEQHG